MLLAIDQGSTKCGMALINGAGVKVMSTTWKLKGKDRYARYGQLIDHLNAVADMADVSDEKMVRIVAVEDVFTKRSGFSNPKTSKIMGETRGIILSVFIQRGIPILNINPAELTKFLHINTRKQNKKEVTQKYIQSVMHFPSDYVLGEDEADACLIGLIAYNKWKEGEDV